MNTNLLKYITFKRFFNLVKIFSSYITSILFGKSVIWGLPASVSVEPVNLCNLSCPECPTGSGNLNRPSGSMSFDSFERIADEISSHCFYIQLFFQGEPLLNRHLFKMIEYSKRKRMYVSVSTNGQLMDRETAEKIMRCPPDKIIFSVDGIDAGSYKKYRKGGSFEKVISGINLLSAMKKEKGLKYPLIEFQMIVMKDNETALDKAEDFARETGADRIVFKSMQLNNPETAKEFLPENPQYSRYITADNKLIIKNKLRDRCFGLWRTTVITWDGRIVPCCFDKEANFEIGILNGKNLEELWKSLPYNSFRNRILFNRKSVDICRNCTSGMKSDLYSRTL